MDIDAISCGIARFVEELNDESRVYRLQGISGGSVSVSNIGDRQFVQIEYPITGKRYVFRSYSQKEAFAEAFAWAVFRRASEAA